MHSTKEPRTNTPERILEVATNMFADYGHRAVTLQAIVQEAQVNTAAINYHFGDKWGLYRTVIERAMHQREDRAAANELALGTLEPREKLRTFIKILTAQLLDENSYSRMSQIMLWEAIDPTPMFEQLVEKLPKRQIFILKAIVRDLVGPALTDEQVERASISILAQCVYYRYGRLMLKAIFPDRTTTPETIENIAEDIYRFSIAALDMLRRG
jgi:AcrR family transcriptional regulator